MRQPDGMIFAGPVSCFEVLFPGMGANEVWEWLRPAVVLET
jgi:hypothetical protein